MNNQNDNYIKSVNFKSKNAMNPKPRLWHDPQTGKIHMDSVDVRDITLTDFARIHSFFRKVQGMKINSMQGTLNGQQQGDGDGTR